MLRKALFVVLVACAAAASSAPVGTAITYQGQLEVGDAPATGLFDLQFCLFDSLAAGAALGCAPDLADVPVDGGLFTVDIDFGATAFAGDARFLELRVRDGDAVAGTPFTTLAPRQALRPAPLALHSAASPWTGITGVPAGFADGVDDATAGVSSITAGFGLSGGTVTSSGTFAVDTSTMQRRVAGECAGGTSIAKVNPDGSVACNAAGAGTVTSIAAGTGLTGGVITGSGTIAVDPSTTQLRVAGQCANGTSIAKVNADGSVACNAAGSGTVTSIAAGTGLTGGVITGSGTLAVDTAAIQQRVAGICAAGTAVTAVNQNGGVQCAALGGTGTVTAVTAGNGLTGGTITSSGTLAVNPASVQSRIAGSCAPGSTVRVVNQDGTVACEAHGTVTSVGAGTGLLGGAITTAGTVSVDTTYVQRRVAGNCSAGAAISLVNPDGTVSCTPAGGSVSSVGTGLGLTGGTITTSGTIAIDPATTQRRVSGVCLAGSYITSVNQDGTVSCGTAPAGTVTSVTAGAGLAGGTISSSGTISVANGGIGLAQINTAEVQARIATTCPPGQYFRGVAANGSVTCEPVPGQTAYSVVDASGDVGRYVSLALAADGLPVIGYYDNTAKALKVAKCADSACSGPATITTLDDPANDVGQFTSIAMRADGRAILAYHDATAQALKVASCANAACTAATISVVDDSASNVGKYTSIAVGGDGLAGISYYDETAKALKFAKCSNADCTASARSVLDDSASDVGKYSSLLITPDAASLPTMSYIDATAHALKAAACTTSNCAAGSITLSVLDDPANFIDLQTSIARGQPDLPDPLISYHDATAGALKLLRCSNGRCTSPSVMAVIDDEAAIVTGANSSIAMPPDGLPVISYLGTDVSLKVAKCTRRNCDSGTTVTTVDASSVVADWSSIAVGGDGRPVIAYRRLNAAPSGPGVLAVKCGNRSCQ